MAKVKSDPPIGRGNPPHSTRFQPNQSGNPRGRPKRKAAGPPFERVFGQIVTITETDGTRRQATLEEAILLKLRQLAMHGNMAAVQQLLKTMEQLEKLKLGGSVDDTHHIEINNWLGSVNDVVLGLKMAYKKDPDGFSPLILLEPWLVEAALAQLGTRELTVEEQREVWEATRTPQRVNWPAWWTERRGTGRPRPKRTRPEEGIFYPRCVRDQREI